MKKSKFPDAQMACALRQAESETAEADVCRQLGVSEATFDVWKKPFAHPGVSRRLHLRRPGGIWTSFRRYRSVRCGNRNFHNPGSCEPAAWRGAHPGRCPATRHRAFRIS